MRQWERPLLFAAIVIAMALVVAGQRTGRRLEQERRLAVAARCGDYAAQRQRQRTETEASMRGRYGFAPVLSPGSEERWAAVTEARLRAARFGQVSANELAAVTAQLDRLEREWKEVYPTTVGAETR